MFGAPYLGLELVKPHPKLKHACTNPTYIDKDPYSFLFFSFLIGNRSFIEKKVHHVHNDEQSVLETITYSFH